MKKLVVGFLAVAIASVAQAEWLIWQVADYVTTDNTGATYNLGTDYNAGKMWAVDGDGKTSVLEIANPATGETMSGVVRAGDDGPWAIKLDQLGDDFSAYSFYLEYVNYDSANDKDNQIVLGATRTYADLMSSIVGDMSDVPSAEVWHGQAAGGGGYNAPEPTSAMLMLLGAAGLALRRKQRKLA